MPETNSQPSAGLQKVIRLGFVLVFLLFAAVLVRWTDNFFADDSYFYLQVAWNIARGMGSTFNNEIATNGYHPLWMLVCVAVFKFIHNKHLAVHAVGAVIALLDAGALLFLARTLRTRAPGMAWIAFTLYVPFAFITQLGTEGAISGFMLAAMVLAASQLLEKPTAARSWAFSLAASLAVLGRLDSIFVVGCVSLAVYVAVLKQGDRASRSRWMAAWLCYPLLWGGYVASNLAWFGTVQPISGMLKSHSKGEHSLFSNLPHVALTALVLILVAFLIVAIFRRDTFFHTVELPFAVGVLVHASYITFVMSSETRWTWYYTSWWILAAILVSRAGSIVLDRRPAILRETLTILALLLVATVWYQLSYRKFAFYQPNAVGVGYQENLVERAGLHTVLAFDKPGRMAYYSDLHVIALDGLMGDLQFQKDLKDKGIAAFNAQHHVDGYIGPPVPFGDESKKEFCGSPYLSSDQLHCIQTGPHEWRPDGVTVYARLTGTPAGYIKLSDNNLVWNVQGNIAAWRLHDTDASR